MEDRNSTVDTVEARLPSLSVCIVAHNEEANIERTLESVVGWAGEVIVVDCESTDETAEIARSIGADVHSQPNRANLNVNKNISFALAHGEWIICLDADEVIPEDLQSEIEQVIARSPAENGFKIPR